MVINIRNSKKSKVRRNPARFDARVMEELRRLANDMASSFVTRGSEALVIKDVDNNQLYLYYWIDRSEVISQFRLYIYEGNEGVVHDFNNVYDAVEAYKHFSQRLWPKPGYAEARRKKLSEQEPLVLPNPARPDNRVLKAMQDLAEETGSQYAGRVPAIITGEEFYYIDMTNSPQYLALAYWFGQNRTFILTVTRKGNPSKRYRFGNIYDAAQAYRHCLQRLWPDPSYPARRRAQLSLEEHPKLPGGMTQ